MPSDKKSSQSKSKVFIVEDHPIVCEHLVKIVNDQPDLVCCGTADSVPPALKGIYETKPNLALIDISLGDTNGLNLIKELKETTPQLPTLVISFMEESLYGERVLRAGARGFVNKHESTQAIRQAIRTVLAGEIYISKTLASKILDKAVSGDPKFLASPIESLTDREIEVLQLLGKGRGSREIAGTLSLSMKTVEVHRDRIKQKLRLKDAAELVHFAINWVNEQNSK